MPVVEVKNLEGQAVGQVELSDAVFAAKVNPHLLHEASRWHLASLRRGTHKVKGRGEVEGSGRKLWRQKGTGRARIGSIRSPLWRKGGTVHGPQPRDYSYRIPRKVLLGALRSALSAKLADQKLTVVESWSLESHKAKPFRQALTRLDGQSTALLVNHEPNRNLELASRNLAGVKLVRTTQLQPYDLMKHDRLMISKDAAERLSRALAPRPAAAEPLVDIQPARPMAKPEATPAEAAPAAKEKKPRAPRKPRAKKD